ncbi:hypothetical protein JCM10213v2_004152 [Rhodosporidiobolus nylandii]
MSTTAQTSSEAPWHAAFPTPSASIATGTLANISPQELKQKLEYEPDLAKRSFVVVDVRRTDFEVRAVDSTAGHDRGKVWEEGIPVGEGWTGQVSVGSLLILSLEQNGYIRGAINLPAHSFFPTLPSLLPILSRYPLVILHCNSCSAGGRGDRCAGWLQDAYDAAGISKDASRAVVLDGGIKGWLKAYGEDETVTVKL